MSTLIIVIIVLFVLKFIYDTFLTGKTEKDWEEYKKNNPNEARVVEFNEGLNLRSKAEVRTDGYYISRLNVPTSNGSDAKLTCMLAFNDLGYAYFEEFEGYPEFENDQMKNMLTFLIGKSEIGRFMGKMRLSPNGAVDIILYDPADMSNQDVSNLRNYQRFCGTVVTNGLILDYSMKNYNYSLKQFKEDILVKNMQFDFKKVDFS